MGKDHDRGDKGGGRKRTETRTLLVALGLAYLEINFIGRFYNKDALSV